MTPHDFKAYIQKTAMMPKYKEAYRQRINQDQLYYSVNELRKTPQKQSKSYLHVVYDGRYHQFGISSNAYRRIKSIQYQKKTPISVLEFVPMPYVDIAEEFLLQHYKKYRVRYKSFIFSEDLIKLDLFPLLFMLRQFAYVHEEYKNSPYKDWNYFISQLH